MDLQKVFSQTKDYETLAEKREVSYVHVEQALDIVRKFIIDKKRIIYGGMAIDLALKIAGDPGIYTNDIIPDYDFMSPQPYEDSNELAQILNKENLPLVSAINALHVTTRRVRVQFHVVADITYIPINIFNSLPTLKYKDLTIIHPLFQRMDFHHAFSYPFENPPTEVVLARSAKDATRFRLLDARYPISPDTKSLVKARQDFSESLFSLMTFHFPRETVIGGMPAYAFLYDLCNGLLLSKDLELILTNAGTINMLRTELAKIIPAKIEFLDNRGTKNKILMTFPKSLTPIITIISDNLDIFPTVGSTAWSQTGTKRKKDPEYKIVGDEYFNRYLDIKPQTRHVIIQQNETTQLHAEILDNKHAIIPCWHLSNIIKEIRKYSHSLWLLYGVPENKNEDLMLVNINNVLSLFLQNYFSNTTLKNQYLNLYWSTIRLVWIMEQIVIAIKNEDQQKALDFQLAMPYFLTTTTYGSENLSLSYLVTNQEKSGSINLRPPFGYYPNQYSTYPQFDPSKSPFFQMDGDKKM